MLDAERGWLKTLLVTVLVLASFYLRPLRFSQDPALRRCCCGSRRRWGSGLALALVFYVWPQIRLGRMFSAQPVVDADVYGRLAIPARWLLGHPRLAERVLILGVEQDAVTIAREMLTPRSRIRRDRIHRR